jgi:hypothetical protein
MAVVNRYLQNVAPGSATDLDSKIARLGEVIASRGVTTVEYADVQKLEAAERKIAEERSLEFFKYQTDEEMLAAIGK